MPRAASAVREAVRALVGLGERQPSISADEGFVIGDRVDDAFPQVPEIEVHRPASTARRSAITLRGLPAPHRRARMPRAAERGERGPAPGGEAIIGVGPEFALRPARARGAPPGAHPGRLRPDRAGRANRCHCAGSVNAVGSAGGKKGTNTPAHGLPRQAHARGGAPARSSTTIAAVVAWWPPRACTP